MTLNVTRSRAHYVCTTTCSSRDSQNVAPFCSTNARFQIIEGLFLFLNTIGCNGTSNNWNLTGICPIGPEIATRKDDGWLTTDKVQNYKLCWHSQAVWVENEVLLKYTSIYVLCKILEVGRLLSINLLRIYNSLMCFDIFNDQLYFSKTSNMGVTSYSICDHLSFNLCVDKSSRGVLSKSHLHDL